jgi:hypothetical protein
MSCQADGMVVVMEDKWFESRDMGGDLPAAGDV